MSTMLLAGMSCAVAQTTPTRIDPSRTPCTRPDDVTGIAESTPQRKPVSRTKADAKAKADKEVKADGEDLRVLDGMDLMTAGKSTLLTTTIARVFTPVSMIDVDGNFNALGFDATTSLPVENASFVDFARHELLFRRGGMLNLYLSYTGRDPCENSGEMAKFRRAETDRFYLGYLRNRPGENAALPYVSHGLGARMIKKELPGERVAGMLTAYVGFGVDGPLYTSSQIDTERAPPGVFSAETYVSYNLLNKRTLQEMFGTQNQRSSFYTFGANVLMNLPGSFQVKLAYMKGLGSFGKDSLGDLVVLTFGYKRPTADQAKATPLPK